MIGWELNEVTMVFLILKSRHFDPFLHVKQTLYTVPRWHVYFTGEERASGDLWLPDRLASFHCAWQKAWWLWLHIRRLTFLANEFWTLAASGVSSATWQQPLAACALRSGSSEVSESLGQLVCVSRRRQWEGQPASLSLRLETDSRLLQMSACLSLVRPVEDALPGSGQGAADVRDEQ